MTIKIYNSENYIDFIKSINKQISEMRNKPADETYLDIILIAEQLLKYRKNTWINILSCK